MTEDHMALLIQAQKGDKQARDKLVENNMGLVRHVIKRFAGRGYDMQDLFQIGCIGLLKAVDKFDTSYDVQFSTYAVPMIMGEIKRFLRDDGRVKVSRSLKQQNTLIRQATERLCQTKGREPTLEELEAATGMKQADIVMAMDAGQDVESIYKSVYQMDGNEICLVDKLPMEKDEQEELVNHLLLEQLLEYLGDEEKQLIRMRYFENITQLEVAKKLGVSQVQVSRMEKKVLMLMRKKADILS